MSDYNENTPIEEIEALLPVDELDFLSALGDQRDTQRWQVGDKAREWIDERGLPVRQICKIIGKRTDYGWERVKDFLYVSRFYFERPYLRERFWNVKYSIFEHAKGTSDPEAVLQSAYDNLTPVGVIKQTFPALLDELKALYNRVLRRHEDEARSVVETAIAKLKELTEK